MLPAVVDSFGHDGLDGSRQVLPGLMRQLVKDGVGGLRPYWSVGLLPWPADMFRWPRGPRRRPFRS